MAEMIAVCYFEANRLEHAFIILSTKELVFNNRRVRAHHPSTIIWRATTQREVRIDNSQKRAQAHIEGDLVA